MGVPKFLTLEELVRDHERLCGEVEELKKQFEGHVHELQTVNISGSIVTTEQPKIESTFDDNFICKLCRADGKKADVPVAHFSGSGRVMPGHTAK